MKRLFQVSAIVLAGFATFLIAIQSGQAEWLDGLRIKPSEPQLLSFQQDIEEANNLLSSACAIKPIPRGGRLRNLPAIRGTTPLSRFRQASSPNSIYQPREEVALAHPSNFGRRFTQDLSGRPVNNEPIIVLHETVGSGSSAINYFRTPHPRDDDQVSYHTLIRENGNVVYLVPPNRRAFGAGNSTFNGNKGNEAVKTNPAFPPSVNNFAYHISLVTPSDGRGNGARHSGYTRAQYQSLAWLVAKTGIPNDRITTHRLVDRSRQRSDPRSFNSQYLAQLLATFPKTNDISMQCTLPAIAQEE
ncbi:N-acetylmuramoyl-L-alanine amidase [Leptolyngbya sp. NIES-2104]|uniref:N-acetylmuramoyl-L-alanine amidase n=1 Tax=Leptolyngbya sp. NIES-2104 TaxID=1552121 RepID=UPI0006EC99CF|nr:peptidoglycan recognition family protein [Leptolyngbya sp. NIES-2104]GAP97209.1 negative regulator of beta-lactamase expression [Leptolyngbya sp. NIES-2104]